MSQPPTPCCKAPASGFTRSGLLGRSIPAFPFHVFPGQKIDFSMEGNVATSEPSLIDGATYPGAAVSMAFSVAPAVLGSERGLGFSLPFTMDGPSAVFHQTVRS
jgi:hypothetical protein